ncbi:MAG: nicotinate-nucleotide adenylyltransferase [Pirellulales bacterium]|nr:nicotinate-nucleotide adenylyltransferase [Pirellulales bacterium]
MRLGIFGGSFDPVHHGHLRLAACCADQGRLDRVLFVPVAAQPLKPIGPVASAAERAAMVATAIAVDPRFELSTLEIERGGASYTIDTLATLADRLPDAELFLLMGADALADLPRWRDPVRLCELATPLVVARAGEPPVDFSVVAPYVGSKRLAEIKRALVEMPPAPIASREIRRRIAAGESWRETVPDSVAEYIAERGLYGAV